MVELLLEQDADGVVPSHMIFEEGYERHGVRILRRMQMGYSEARTIKIGDSEDTYEILAFKGADLRNNRDVKVVKGSSLPDSKSARSLRVERRYQQGLLGDPGDPKTRRRVLRMLDDAIVDDVYSDYKKDELLAQWENRNLEQGKRLRVNIYDNHYVHLDEHDRIRKTIRFQKLKLEDPQTFEQVDMNFQAHRAEHQKFINEEMQKQMAIMNARGGSKG